MSAESVFSHNTWRSSIATVIPWHAAKLPCLLKAKKKNTHASIKNWGSP
jgi:hypothetical protein